MAQPHATGSSGRGTTRAQWDLLLHNATLATMTTSEVPYGRIDQGAIAFKDGRIAWVGHESELSAQAREHEQQIDCGGKLLTPGLIDCHTHLVYGGHRAKEFEMRLNGASYADISKAGGGILSTVRATREACENELFDAASIRLQKFIRQGVTSVEIKSGYGLTTQDELKMLRVARQLGDAFPVDVATTFLGAHAIPAEYTNRTEEYVALVCDDMLPAVVEHNLADAVDAFCESIAFDTQQVERVFNKARELGLPVKLHAEQLSNMQGAAMAARYDALSVDHLEFLADSDVSVLAEHSTVAVLLPGAFYYLHETQLPPIGALRDNKVPIALASDHNPGSSPVMSFSLVLNMGCVLFGLTPEEALAAVTRHAATALGRQHEVGTLEAGKKANVAMWDTSDPADLSYAVGGNLCVGTYYNGCINSL
ncbi:MAG: imidazolonepropionase [Gammaproteobacteria bacterium]